MELKESNIEEVEYELERDKTVHTLLIEIRDLLLDIRRHTSRQISPS